jgi:hypothetical protein
MDKYGELLRLFREARGRSRKYDQQTRDYAVALVRSVQQALDVPKDRFQMDIASEDIRFDADGWFRIRFAILFPEWEGSDGGDNIWFTFHLRPENGDWLAKSYADAQPSRITSAFATDDTRRFIERFAEELRTVVGRSLEEWVREPHPVGGLLGEIGFRVPKNG